MPTTSYDRVTQPLSTYIQEIRSITTEATSLHREWTFKLAQLVAALETDGIDHVLDRTGNAGLFFDLSFARCRRRLSDHVPPIPARSYHAYWLDWLDKMILASRALASAAQKRDRAMLGQCRTILVEARDVLKQLSAEADRLEVEVSRERCQHAA